MHKMWTIRSLLKEAESYLGVQRILSPRLEAELLLANALRLDRVGLYTGFASPVEPAELDRFRSLIQRRANGEPSAYITGRKEFFSLTFQVEQGVLIPRPETEEVVQAALDLIEGEGAGWKGLDLCTGSGCIVITLLKLRKALEGVASDRSAEALEVAGRNAAKHGVSERLSLLCGNLLEPFQAASSCGFDLITCNPPYVDPEGPYPVDPEVKAFEPDQALFTPPGDPCFYYRRVLEEAVPFLKKSGILLFELGAGLRGPVGELARGRGWRISEVRKDLSGIDRVMRLRPPSS